MFNKLSVSVFYLPNRKAESLLIGKRVKIVKKAAVIVLIAEGALARCNLAGTMKREKRN
jgi:hypothetical protein